jgi:membrane fusion protein (multidrug efflux system)
MPGMYVRAIVSNAVLDDGLLVPQQAIARDPMGNASAMVLTDEDKVEQRGVTVRRAVGDEWLVNEGLGAGDRVIVEGLQKIRPGMQVQATEAALNDEGPEPGSSRAFEPDAGVPAAGAVDAHSD